MKNGKTFYSLLAAPLSVVLLLPSSAGFTAPESRIVSGMVLPSLESVAAMTEAEIDLATVLLSIANTVHRKYYNQDIEVHAYMQHIDRMAVRLQEKIGAETNPEMIVAAMNEFFYQEAGFHWDEAAEQDGRRMDNLLLNSVMDRKSGTCAGLSFAYMAVGQRIGLPLRAVFVPEHVFVRYDDGKARINIEAMDQGKGPSDRYYMRNKRIRPDEPFYMHSLNKKYSIGVYLYALGLLYQKKEMLNSALETYKQSLLFTPAEPHVTQQIGHLYRQMEKPWLAAEYYEQSLAVDPGNAITHSGLADAYMRMNDMTKAMEHHGKAVELDPENAVIRYNAASSFFIRYEFQEAQRELHEALKIDPKLEQAYYLLGEIEVRQGRPEEAVPYLQKSLELNPQFSEAARLLRSVREKMIAAREMEAKHE